MTAKVKLTGNWKSLQAIVTPRKTTQVITQAVLKTIADALLDAVKDSFTGLKENAKLTQALKGRNEPGVDSEELKKHIKVIFLPGKRGVWVGIEKSSPAAAYAGALIDGSTITVTDDMRQMFYLLWQASEGRFDPANLKGRAKTLWDMMPGGWLPLKSETTEIIVPPRNVMAAALATLQNSRALDRLLLDAIDKGIRSRVRSSK